MNALALPLARLSYGAVTWEQRASYHYTTAILHVGSRVSYALLVSAN